MFQNQGAPMTHGRFIGRDAEGVRHCCYSPRNNGRVSAVLRSKESFAMATNNPRHGYERKRSQLKTKTMGQKHWTKRSRKTGEFMDQKKAGKFKSVRREKSDK
jgi:hypothetical protein